MMRDLLNVLPDERPVTSLCVVEDPTRKPVGFHVVHRTYDQDVDADLWKEGFFGKKITRYLCLSKSEGRDDHVIDSMTVINDRELPPEGYTVLTHTADSEQKATKKRLICYRTMPGDKAGQAITDIIVLSKSKKAPTGFTLAGDMNGFLVCFKATSIAELGSGGRGRGGGGGGHGATHSNGVGRYSSYYSNSHTVDRLKASPRPVTTARSKQPAPSSQRVTQTASSRGRPPLPLPPAQPHPPPLYPVDQLQSVTSVQPPVRNCTLPRNMGQTRTWAHSRHYAAPNHYQSPAQPPVHRQPLPPPTPTPPPPPQQSLANHSSGSGAVISGVDGVVFQVNPNLRRLEQLKNFVIPSLDCKTFDQIEAEFKYDFRVEREALQRHPPEQESAKHHQFHD